MFHDSFQVQKTALCYCDLHYWKLPQKDFKLTSLIPVRQFKGFITKVIDGNCHSFVFFLVLIITCVLSRCQHLQFYLLALRIKKEISCDIASKTSVYCVDEMPTEVSMPTS